ncbi:glycosyltransferase [Arsukibacterium sp.]|uniref:glycosyltransferase n=1 Tax=Arsukibacterium sp. TaxID=1977258 RepID=UPI002FD8BAA8
MLTFSLALVMIVKNEARSIQRCLDSISPFVDSMLVLDTGSTDNTVALARACGARVEHFRWRNDFAAARNAALAFSNADWNIILDADEWLSRGKESLQQLRQQKPDFVGSVEIVSSYVIADCKQHGHSIISRVLPKGVRYKGIIHEQPEHVLPVKPLQIQLGHDGYEPAQQQAKKQRNLQLLQLALQHDPDDCYLHYKLGVELELAGQSAAAIKYYEQASHVSSKAITWRLDLVIRLLFLYKKHKCFSEGLMLAEQESALRNLSADFDFALGDFYLELAIHQPVQATVIIPKIEQCWLNCLKKGEVSGVNGAVAGRGSFLAAHNLAIFYQSLGKTDQSQHYFQLASDF